MRTKFVYMIMAALLLGSCARHLSPEEQAQVQALKGELDETKEEISETQVQGAKYTGGLIKSLIAIRLELLKTNEALLQQRIQAIEAGAEIKIQTSGTKPDPVMAAQLEAELTRQALKVSEAEANANRYSGGLVAALAMMTVTTEQNSLAMLRQKFLVAKYGLAPLQAPQMPPVQANAGRDQEPAVAPPAAQPEISDLEMRKRILVPTIISKKYTKQEYEDYIFFDISFSPRGLDRSARAIKGSLIFSDLFGEEKFSLRWTIDKPVSPAVDYTERGSGFKYNQFMDDHQWVRNTELENMKVDFVVDSIIYADGTTHNF